MIADSSHELHRTGETAPISAPVGTLTCTSCGYAVAAAAVIGRMPRCPACHGTSFRRRSIFERPAMDVGAISALPAAPGWIEEARGLMTGEVALAYERDGEPAVYDLPVGWTRIGRSGAADIRLDHSTVSRRHALVVRTEDHGLRALDDRSLNGLFVNGERVEWSRLRDGDELEVGRFRLYVLTA